MMRPVLVVLFVMVPAFPLAAQAMSTDASPRVWVRQALPLGSLDGGVKGTVERISGDTLIMRRDGSATLLTVVPDDRTRFQLIEGTRRATGKGARLGLLVGGVAGLLLGMTDGGGCSAGGTCVDGGTTTIFGALLFGGLGAGVGAIVGAYSMTDVWSEPMSATAARRAFTRVPGATAARLTIPF